ncbi:hypothetical protein [Mucilaginibacter sp. SP1R1]|uniref:hypothetical protein n=1 Tax=Mucilaginibacter sp. SP1R1 TaxID=2723091 RepID=UPI001611A7BB|nr:hypothetical protein [Mucilaginibacter sp. SP1R1]MBB6150192.1 hypothetical protein [Mucilaginibacter sp. SP1R1]
MNPELITFKKFNDIALANALADLLEQHHIPYNIEESSLAFNPAFVNSELSKDYAVKIKGDDFTTVNKLLNDSETENINQVEKDYYLFDFADEELLDILAKADEWSAFDYQLARKILADRGIEVNDNILADLSKSRIEELKEPEPPQTSWVIIGYIFALGGGIIGLFVGWHLSTYKKTLPDGERVYGYNENDRKQGKWIFYLSIVVFAISIIYKIAPAFTGSGN